MVRWLPAGADFGRGTWIEWVAGLLSLKEQNTKKKGKQCYCEYYEGNKGKHSEIAAVYIVAFARQKYFWFK